jgi:hypothetical protein
MEIMYHLPDEDRKRVDLHKVEDGTLFNTQIRQRIPEVLKYGEPFKFSNKRKQEINVHAVDHKKRRIAASSTTQERKPCFYCDQIGHNCYEKKGKQRIYSCPLKLKDMAAGKNVRHKDDIANINHTQEDAYPGDNAIVEIQEGIQEVSTVLEKEFRNDKFVIDSGSGVHIGTRTIAPRPARESCLSFPNNTKKTIRHKGTLRLNKFDIILNDVLHAPDCGVNILSEHKLIKENGFIIQNSTCGEYKTLRVNGISIRAYQENGVYILSTDVSEKLINSIQNPTQTDKEEALRIAKHLHLVFGHISHNTILQILNKESVNGLPPANLKLLREVEYDCSVCAAMKQTRMTYRNLIGSRPDTPCHTVHTDTRCIEKDGCLAGRFGYKYSLNIVDDCTSYKWIFALKKKTDARECLKIWKARVERQYDVKVKIIRSDGGKHEYFNQEINKFCLDEGILHQSSNPYCQSENGAAERYNAIDAAYIRTLLASVNFPDYLWPEAQRHGVYLDNRTPKRRLGWVTPYECLYQKKPEVKDLPIFGSLLTAFIPEELRKKKTLGPRAVKARFLGVEEQYKAYRIWDLDNNIITHSRSVKINKEFIKEIISSNFDTKANLSFKDSIDTEKATGCPRGSNLLTEQTPIESLPEEQITNTQNDPEKERLEPEETEKRCSISAGDSQPAGDHDIPDGYILAIETLDRHPTIVSALDVDENEASASRPNPYQRSDQPARRLTATATRKPNRHGDFLNFVNHLQVREEAELKDRIKEPMTLTEALNSKNRKEWQDSVAVEHQALKENGTWDLVPLPKGRKAIKSKWVFKIKYLANDKIDKFKSRLVVVGCMQKNGLDYTEVFSPVCRLESLRVFLALSAALDLELHQLDISTAFLHADIDEEVYMTQPLGTVEPGTEHLVCRLKKALYGLRQSPRLFYQLLHSYLLEIGFTRTNKDHCIYIKKAGDGKDIILAVYVDDLTIGCTCLTTLQQIKEELKKRFKITDGGEINYILKMQVKRNRKEKKLYLYQTKYIKDLISHFGLSDAVPTNVPQIHGKEIIAGKTLTKEEEARQGIPYRNLVGALVHIQRGTRPDISNAVRELSRFLNCYSTEHFVQASRVLRYLKRTSDYGLVFDGNSVRDEIQLFQVYSDASFGNKELRRRSVTGFVILLAGAAVSYKSICQNCISISTFEAEMIACSEACRESEWLRMLLEELGLGNKNPIPVFCDNSAVVASVKNPVNHKGSKHFEIRHLYARELQEKKKISIEYLNTKEMIGDIMTKALPEKQFIYLREKLGVKLVPDE